MFQKSGRIIFTAILLLTASRAMAQKTVDEIIAWVNNDIILKSEFDLRKAAIRNDLAEAPPRGRGLQGAQLEQAFGDAQRAAFARPC